MLTEKQISLAMQQALDQATIAFKQNEVPVGAVLLTENGEFISAGHNQKHASKQVVDHAEIVCIKNAVEKLNDWRLENTIMVSTLEPCPMCFGAILHSRITEVIFGAHDLKWGACGTIVDLSAKKLFNHFVKTTYFEEKKASDLLKKFFDLKRKNIEFS